MRKHVLEKTVESERGKRKYPARRCHVCETRYICKFWLVPLHKVECFQRHHTLKHYYGLWKVFPENFSSQKWLANLL